jgi:Domain of unknown function (DUF5618)
MTTSNDLIQTKKAYIKEAKRFLANAKETIAKSPIDGKLYTDEKYVREGAGIAYLAALKAIDGFLIGKGISKDKLPTSIEEYWAMKKKHIPHNGKFTQSFTIVYQHLHIATYYRAVTTLSNMKEGLQAVKEIIAMLEDE